jgi:hypothetical protein
MCEGGEGGIREGGFRIGGIHSTRGQNLEYGERE